MNLRPVFELMLAELQSSPLIVELCPAPDPRHECHFIRVAVSRNPKWYRDLCARFLSQRIRSRSLPDTAIKRAQTVRTLEKLAAGQPVSGLYVDRLTDCARAYVKKHPLPIAA